MHLPGMLHGNKYLHELSLFSPYGPDCRQGVRCEGEGAMAKVGKITAGRQESERENRV